MLVLNPEHRITAKEALDHPYFKGKSEKDPFFSFDYFLMPGKRKLEEISDIIMNPKSPKEEKPVFSPFENNEAENNKNVFIN